ncbi:tripartite motif-containing protein 16-like [Erpetoichthys calabaricus]|uniref:tripartite motif-containing protein 16-like n=1 Tax=Erpetoichthys calabaricus TaxID=27687 RepID=UPI002234DF95|nr:tripartite motif-containing protein 16-like [Erpetoichthys calabaricus]
MCSNVTEQIRQQEKKEAEKAKRAMKQLEKEIENMKRKSADMTELLKTDDHTHFFKTVSSFCVPLDGKASPKINFSRQFSSEILRMEISYLKEHLMKISEWKMKQLSLSASGTPIYILISSDQKERLELLQYSCPITLDPNTAHRQLNVSEENKKVTVTEKQANYDDNPDRFDNWWQILSREALTGTRCYWEVDVCGKVAEIGITYKGIGRKGNSNDSKLGSNNHSWSMHCSNCSSSLWHNNKSTISKTAEIHYRRVGVYLDWSAGILKFYGVTDSAVLLHTFQTKYTEPLYPAFRLPYHNCSVTICTISQTGK